MTAKHRFTAPAQQLNAQAADASQRAVSNSPARGEPTEDEIRQHAYEIYRIRGTTPGSAAEDWAQAERELRGGRK